MNLDRKELIVGHPIKKVRDFLKNHFEHETDVSSAPQLSAEHFGNDSEAVLAELIKRGWLEKGQRTWTPAVGPATVHATYNRTDLGQRVAIAKLIARFPRATGDAVLKAVIERAHQINANPELCSYIRELRLFGSMLDPSITVVGDVDVAVELGRRKPPLGPNGMTRDWVEWNIERFEISGRAGGSFLDRICYGEFEVMRLLKSRVAGLSLHTLEDLNSIGAASSSCGNCARDYKIRRIVPSILHLLASKARATRISAAISSPSRNCLCGIATVLKCIPVALWCPPVSDHPAFGTYTIYYLGRQ